MRAKGRPADSSGSLAKLKVGRTSTDKGTNLEAAKNAWEFHLLRSSRLSFVECPKAYQKKAQMGLE